MAGERDHLLTEAFLQATVANEGPGAVVDQAGAEARIQIGLGYRHAEGVGNALAERTRGDLDAAGGLELGVTGAMRAQLAEGLDLFEADLVVAGEVQQRVQQHRAMAVRQHEAVTVGPGGIGRVELEVTGEQRGGDLRHAQRHALMALGGVDDGIERQKADGVGELARFYGMHGKGSPLPPPVRGRQ